ncbi:hypothetical protein PQR34_14495 [Paraburkholderia sediminicola]|uniref:hypothetical protein n=1 Tax=Paraburkholderia sediminicola TaxID=458836 RepID=UPI0038B9A0B8
MRRNLHRHILHNSQPPSTDCTAKPIQSWPQDKSWRYASDWNADVVLINVSDKKFPTANVKPFDLGKILMDVRGKRSPYKEMRRLRDFRGFIKALKIGLNSVCHRNDDGSIPTEISVFISTCTKFFIWCIRHGIHNLTDVTPSDVHQCVAEVGRRGWFDMLEYKEAFRTLLRRTQSDIELAESLRGASTHVRYLTLNLDAIEEEVGLPLCKGRAIPRFFAEGLRKTLGDKRKQPARSLFAMKNAGGLMRTLKLLSMLPFSDSLPFQPYYDVNDPMRPIKKAQRTRRERLGRDGRTQNLPLPQAIALLEHSLKWAFDYYPAIIELLEVALDRCATQLDKPHLEKVMRDAIRLAYPAIKEKYQLPFVDIELNIGKNALRSMIAYLMTATMVLIAINHGRRRNEIIGYKKFYGLYYGCVRFVAPESDNRKIEIYIEKTLRDYATFWCNVLVQRCVERLEAIWTLVHRLDSSAGLTATPAGQGKNVTDDDLLAQQRRRKLFVLPLLSKKGLTATSNEPDYSWSQFAPTFFTMAGLDLRDFPAHTHPFRRLFAILYVYRYDSSELLALSQHFFHITIDQTDIYVTDPKARRQKDRIAALYTKVQEEVRGLRELLSDARTGFLVKKIEELLNGKPLGGAFPRLVLRFVKQLSMFSEFTKLTNNEKARLLTERLENIGYKVNEKANGACMVGTTRRGRGKANCYRDGDVHPETAAPKTCHACSFSMTTETTIKWFELDRDQARAQAENPRLSPALRLANKREADLRDVIIDLERRFSEDNARQYAAVEATWPARDSA